MNAQTEQAVDIIAQQAARIAELEGMLAAASAPKAELTDEQIDKIIQSHGTGGWQTVPDMRKFARAVLAQAAPVAALWQAAEKLAQIWDGVKWDEGGDIGATIRHDFAMYAEQFGAAAPVAVPEGWNLPKEIPFETMKAAERSGISFAALCRVWDFLVAAAPAAPVAAAVPAGWVKNTGVQPVADDVLVDIELAAGRVWKEELAGDWDWEEVGECAVVAWRLAAPAPDGAAS